MVRQRLKWVSSSLPALVHGRQSHVLTRDSQEAVQTCADLLLLFPGQVREKDAPNVASCGMWDKKGCLT